jgi:lipoprotein-releasing system permease protein
MSRLELSMAWRYLRSRRGSRLLSLISVIAVAGVIVGVSALIVIIGVMNGMQRDLRDKILVASPDVRVLPFGGDLVMPEWREVLTKVKRDPGVVAAAPFVHIQALLSPQTKYVTAVYVMGIVPDSAFGPFVTSIRTTATTGKFTFRAPDGSDNGIMIGDRLAKTLNILPGVTRVELITMDPTHLDPVTGNPSTRTETFPVTGTFSTGMYEYDDAYAFLALKTAQRLAQLDTAVTGLEIRTPTREDARAVGIRLQDSLGLVRTDDWQSQNSALFSALKLEKAGMAFILLLIILVAAFNIVGTLSMVVSDKTREIGILRAMGMTASSIRRVFFAQGMIIGAVGTVTGTAIGLIASYLIDHYKLIHIQADVYFIDHLPVATQLQDVVAIVVASLAIAALATVYPARQAATLYPVEAIRHE